MSKKIKSRYFFVLGTFLLTILLYVDRICISVAKDGIVSDIGLTERQFGWVLSAFALGYALFQAPAGIFADRKGPRIVLTLIVTIWSIFTALTGAVRSFFSLITVRALFGAGEAGAFPSISRAVFSWIPMRERGLVTGINFSGSRLGAAFALPAIAWLIEETGWRESFYILGAIGVIWAVLWYFLFRDDPVEHPFITEKEKKEIEESRQTKSTVKTRLKFSHITKSRNMWLLMLQYFSSNFTFFFCLTWLFPYIKQTYQLDTIEAGLYSSAPLLFGAFGNWFSGWLVDFIYARGQWRNSRRITAMIGFFLAAAGLLGGLSMDSVLGAIIFLSIAIFGADMTLSPSWALCVDIGKEHAGGVSGTMNMAGNIGSFITALAFPYLKEWSGSVVPFFIIGALLNLIAMLAWRYIDPEKPIS